MLGGGQGQQARPGHLFCKCQGQPGLHKMATVPQTPWELMSFQEMRGWSYVRGGLDQGLTKGVHCRGPVIPQRKEEHLVLSQAAVPLTGLWGERSVQFRVASGIPKPTDLSRSDRDGVEVLGLKAEGPEACLSSCH